VGPQARAYFGGVCELSFLSSWGGWFVGWGVLDGAVDSAGAAAGVGGAPAGRVTTVPFFGGKYSAPF
jgi:hypothetical protein